MAERRMFARTIIDSDAFLEMPLSTQSLYFHLSMRADDEGFINNPKKIARMIGANEDELKVLLGKNFVIGFESGVIVIKHWRIHNYIRGDRLRDTVYKDERGTLEIKDNGTYTQCQSNVSQMSVKCQHSIGEDRLGKDSIGEDNISPKGSSSVFSVDVISHLNHKTKSNYRHGIKKTISLIDARRKEGFTLEDFKIVIDKKTEMWIRDAKMSKYLRPETLFGTKFESYLNEIVPLGYDKPIEQRIAESNAITDDLEMNYGITIAMLVNKLDSGDKITHNGKSLRYEYKEHRGSKYYIFEWVTETEIIEAEVE